MKGGIRRLFTSCIHLLSLENWVMFNQILHYQGNMLIYANNTNMFKYKYFSCWGGVGVEERILKVLLNRAQRKKTC